MLAALTSDFDQYLAKSSYANGSYVWSDSFNHDINAWCKTNICDTMYWGFQIITADIATHRDFGTEVKMTYIVHTGGDQVLTNFYDDTSSTILHSYKIEPHRWHIFQASTPHSVTNIQPGQTRFSITGRVFPL